MPSERQTKSNGLSTRRWERPTGFTDEIAMEVVNQLGLFPLGRIHVTEGIYAAIEIEEMLDALVLHAQGNWGDVCDADRRSNEEALVRHFRLLSVYHGSDRTKFWIITEADRSYTTILLPEEY